MSVRSVAPVTVAALELGEADDAVEGVRAVGGRADALQTEFDAVEVNLETVRQALKDL